MAITPRKEELARIVEIIETGDYDTSEGMARDLFKTCFNFLRDREWYIVGSQYGQYWDNAKSALLYGFETSELSAIEWARQYSPGVSRVALLSPMGRVEKTRVDGEAYVTRDEWEKEEALGYHECAKCKHLKPHHGFVLKRQTNQTVPKCRGACKCDGYEPKEFK